MDEEKQPDPRTLEEDICQASEIGPTGIEWMCVRKSHPSTDLEHPNHYFVNRYPNRQSHDG